ncbi:MAG TPA: sigma factor-like helix-turn-helix DNA-binding protein, partial [Candidatus Saccharimonas sp.]|nr:sigma factor-like helix-turn-helix DNA-binding protein [Candidatus Saccharimonas sp.]
NGEDTTLLDMVGITAEPAEQDQWLEASHIQQSVLEALWDLGEDDKRMLDILLLSAGFYFADEGCEEYGEPLSLRQIGKIYNLTGEAIRQIRKRAIEKLKRHPALAEFRRHQQ